jgi:hypothetical protein
MEVVAVLEGCLSAVEVFCAFPEELQKELCSVVARYVLGSSAEFSIDAFLERVSVAGLHCECKAAEDASGLILHLYRVARRLNLDANQLAEQLSTTSAWTQQSVSVVKNTWEQQVQLSPSATQFVNIGQLVDMEWCFGMSMSSSSCRSLNSPFITVLLKVAEPSGLIVSRSFEMTMPEFQNFARQIREMAHTFETS